MSQDFGDLAERSALARTVVKQAERSCSGVLWILFFRCGWRENSGERELMTTRSEPDYAAMLEVALAEARTGLGEGGIPIGAAMFDGEGKLLGRGRNRRVQENDPSVHAETDAFRKAGRQRSYRDLVMATTLAPCWYCSGLVRQFNIGTLVVGETVNFQGGVEWLREHGVKVVDLQSADCISLLANFVVASPDLWNEDIGKD